MILHLTGSSIRRDSENQGENSDKYVLPVALSPWSESPSLSPWWGTMIQVSAVIIQKIVSRIQGQHAVPWKDNRSERCDMRLPGFKSQLGHWFVVCFFTCLSPSFLKHQKCIYLTGLLCRLSEPKYMSSIR